MLLIDKLGRYGERLAIIVSAVAFGLFHGNLSQLIYATGIGLIFGFVYVKTGRVVYSCLLHILVNFFGTVPSLLARESLERLEALPTDVMPEITDTLLLDVALVALIVLVQYLFAIIGTLAIVRSGESGLFKCEMKSDVPLERKNIVGCVLLNLGALAYLALCIYISVEIPDERPDRYYGKYVFNRQKMFACSPGDQGRAGSVRYRSG